MPFGLWNGPATFERLMEHVLKGLDWKTYLVYLDDIVVICRTFNEHFKNLGEVLQRITAAGLNLSVKKCALFQKQVKYLGHLVTADGTRPQNLHELCRFLGLCTYYRRFVPNMAASLHEFTKKAKVYQWDESQ